MDNLSTAFMVCLVLLVANVTLMVQKYTNAQGNGVMSMLANKLSLPEKVGTVADIAVSAVGVAALALAMRATDNLMGYRVNANFAASRS
jgi:hypothetical protein